jgi:predicted nucleotidyltransferase
VGKVINEKEREIIIEVARKYKASAIYLFGSSLVKGDYNDIDLAVNGVKPEVFFKFYGELLRRISKPIDLVDLSKETMFNKLVLEKGVRIYG